MKTKQESNRGSGRAVRACLRGYWAGGAAALVSLLLLSFLCAAQSSDEPLGDVARARKPVHKAEHVVTNDEIPSVETANTGNDPAATTNSPTADTDRTEKTVSAPGSADSKPSKSGISVPGVLTNGTLAQARAALETLKHDRQAFIANYDKIERRLAETDNDALRQSYSDILATRDKTLARNTQEISQLESAIRAAQDASGQGGTNETQ